MGKGICAYRLVCDPGPTNSLDSTVYSTDTSGASKTEVSLWKELSMLVPILLKHPSSIFHRRHRVEEPSKDGCITVGYSRELF